MLLREPPPAAPAAPVNAHAAAGAAPGRPSLDKPVGGRQRAPAPGPAARPRGRAPPAGGGGRALAPRPLSLPLHLIAGRRRVTAWTVVTTRSDQLLQTQTRPPPRHPAARAARACRPRAARARADAAASGSRFTLEGVGCGAAPRMGGPGTSAAPARRRRWPAAGAPRRAAARAGSWVSPRGRGWARRRNRCNVHKSEGGARAGGWCVVIACQGGAAGPVGGVCAACTWLRGSGGQERRPRCRAASNGALGWGRLPSSVFEFRLNKNSRGRVPVSPLAQCTRA